MPRPPCTRRAVASRSTGTRVTRFRYLVTTRVDQGTVVEAPWVPSVPPGDYVVRVLAEDAFGNVAETGRDLPITVAFTP